MVPFGQLAEAVDRRGGIAVLLSRVALTEGDLAQREVQRLRRAWSRGRAAGSMTPAAADLLVVHLLGSVPQLVWDNWDELDAYAPRRRRPARCMPTRHKAA